MNNPFPYSDTNKRFHTLNYYFRQTYHTRVYKISLNAGLTCPNRDGVKGYGGCTFCSSKGSGDFIPLSSIEEQFQKGLEFMHAKWPDAKAAAYFQAFTNTYAPLPKLKELFTPFINDPEVVCLIIATRPDCLSQACLDYLAQIHKQKHIMIELGLQTIHEATAKLINRGHDYACFQEALQELRKRNIPVCVHLINSLPYETKEMMIETAATLASLDIQAIKLHMLYISEGTLLAQQYKEQPFPLLSMNEFIEVVAAQLELLPPNVIIERVSGDGDKATLLAPKWTANKLAVLNGLDQYMALHNMYQGRLYKKT